MHRVYLWFIVMTTLAVAAACGPQRMAPFAPHRTNTDFHHTAQANQACLGCHEINQLGKGHQPTDDCLRCHRIVQGE